MTLLCTYSLFPIASDKIMLCIFSMRLSPKIHFNWFHLQPIFPFISFTHYKSKNNFNKIRKYLQNKTKKKIFFTREFNWQTSLLFLFFSFSCYTSFFWYFHLFNRIFLDFISTRGNSSSSSSSGGAFISWLAQQAICLKDLFHKIIINAYLFVY